jgi:hypothetical protein
MLSIPTIALLLLAPVAVWRIYSRIKTQMMRQRSIMQRHYTGLGAFSAMALVAAAQLASRPAMLGWLLAGVAGGIAYGIWGLKLTGFESTREGCFFTPNRRLGLVIAMQFVALLMYIAFSIYANQGSGNQTPNAGDFPFSAPSLGLVAGYFATYSAGLLKWRFKLRKEINEA